MAHLESLKQVLKKYTESQQVVIIELITSKELNFEELCPLSTSKTNEDQPLSPMRDVYEMRSLVLLASGEEPQKIQDYLSSRLEDLHKKIPPEEVMEITGENLVSFLSQTSDYLFEKVGTSLSSVSRAVQESVGHVRAKTKTDSHISQSMCEQLVNTTIDGVFKAVVSGVMNDDFNIDINKTIEESVKRVGLGVIGLDVSNSLKGIDPKIQKSSVKGGLKTLSKTESLLGASVAAVGGAAIASLPKRTADVALHGIIGAVSGYMKTGTVAGTLGSAVKGAVSRGIYSYGWELLDGKLTLIIRIL